MFGVVCMCMLTVSNALLMSSDCAFWWFVLVEAGYDGIIYGV